MAHEQLQYFFNRHTFKIELEEYQKEGINVDKITFRDNLALIDMFLGKPIGVLTLLDEESNFPKATDQTFVDKLDRHFKDNTFYCKPDQSCDFPTFGIQHFAGKVEYNATYFLEKNRDNLAGMITELMCTSQVPLLQGVFSTDVNEAGQIRAQSNKSKTRRGEEVAVQSTSKVHRKTPTLSAQFKHSLKTLIDRMTACHPHFIRCIKPNFDQQKNNFIDDFVLTQMKYTGVLEATRIRQEGYSWRPSFEEFVQRYKILAFETNKLGLVRDGMESAQKIIKTAKLKNFHIGKTKLFLKYYHLAELERLVQQYFASVTKAQAVVRAYFARKRYRYQAFVPQYFAVSNHIFCFMGCFQLSGE